MVRIMNDVVLVISNIIVVDVVVVLAVIAVTVALHVWLRGIQRRFRFKAPIDPRIGSNPQRIGTQIGKQI